MRSQQRPLSIFLFFLSVFSGCTYALDVHSHRLTSTLAQFIVWCPGAAALCTCLLLRIPLGTLGWSWPPRRSLSLAYFLPALRHAGVPAHLAGRSRLLHPPELRSLDGSALWIDPLGRLRDVWRGAAAVVYRRRCLRSGVVARRGTRMARVPVSPAAAAARLPRRLPDLRVDLGRVALSGTPLDRLQAGHKAHLLPRVLHDHGDRAGLHHGLP